MIEIYALLCKYYDLDINIIHKFSKLNHDGSKINASPKAFTYSVKKSFGHVFDMLLQHKPMRTTFKVYISLPVAWNLLPTASTTKPESQSVTLINLTMSFVLNTAIDFHTIISTFSLLCIKRNGLTRVKRISDCVT